MHEKWLDELFSRFSVESGGACVIDKAYVQNCVTDEDLVAYSKRRNMPLHIIKRGEYVVLVDGAGARSKKFSELDEGGRRHVVTALDAFDKRNTGYWGQ